MRATGEPEIGHAHKQDEKQHDCADAADKEPEISPTTGSGLFEGSHQQRTGPKHHGDEHHQCRADDDLSSQTEVGVSLKDPIEHLISWCPRSGGVFSKIQASNQLSSESKQEGSGE